MHLWPYLHRSVQELVTVNLAFTSNWLGKKRGNFKPTVERNKQKSNRVSRKKRDPGLGLVMSNNYSTVIQFLERK